jgi:hypothetical protein
MIIRAVEVLSTCTTSFEISSNKLNGVDGNLFNDVISSSFNGPVSLLSLEPTPELMAEEPAIPKATDAEHEDDFPGFPPFDEVPVEQPSAVSGSTDDEGFGDFEVFPKASHIDSTNAVAIENDPVILKDDRGGFDDFGNSNTLECAPDNNAANSGIDNPLMELIDDDDGFRDFGLCVC